MSLLHDIQEAIIAPASDLGPILLKLRLLADRLGSDQLEEWVKFESEGYPPDTEVPDYRRVAVSYSGNFTNIAWSAQNQPIPSAIIKKVAGEQWETISIRESIAAIDGLLRNADSGGTLTIDASNLILILQGKVYKGMNCNAVSGKISTTAVHEIQNTVRNRILDLTMKLQKQIPGAADITIKQALRKESDTAEKIAHVVNMTVHGPNTMITNTGSHSQITVNNAQGDAQALKNELVKAGIPKAAANEFTKIITSEEAESHDRPFGARAREWLSKNIGKAADGTWKVSVAVATKVLEEAALRYYGLKD